MSPMPEAIAVSGRGVDDVGAGAAVVIGRPSSARGATLVAGSRSSGRFEVRASAGSRAARDRRSAGQYSRRAESAGNGIARPAGRSSRRTFRMRAFPSFQGSVAAVGECRCRHWHPDPRRMPMNPCSFGQLLTGPQPRKDHGDAQHGYARRRGRRAASRRDPRDRRARRRALDPARRRRAGPAPGARRGPPARRATTSPGDRGASRCSAPRREVASVPASALLGPQRLGRWPPSCATRSPQAGGHYAVVDDVGRGVPGRRRRHARRGLRAASAGRPAPYSGGGPPSRAACTSTSPPAAGAVLTDPAQRRPADGARPLRAGSGSRPRGWTPLEWLTWPAEAQPPGVGARAGRSRVHVAMLRPATRRALWARARTGSACATLAQRAGRLPRRRLDRGLRRAVPARLPAPPPARSASRLYRRPGPAPRRRLARWWPRAGREATGLAIPPGGLVTPPLVAGRARPGDPPARATTRSGWPRASGVDRRRPPGRRSAWSCRSAGRASRSTSPIGGDGSAAARVHPHRSRPGDDAHRRAGRRASPPPSAARPTWSQPLAATAGSARRCSPASSRIPDALGARRSRSSPTGGSVGDPVLVIVPPFG